ncbi:MAG: two-component sensor histidine kinase [Chloroflexi bacterium]|nr:two-component sensor histidine kinase [Chloroflexota bacterium]
MPNSYDHLWSNWGEQIAAFVEGGQALAVGVFAVSGHPQYLNAGMQFLLGMEDETKPATERFVVPPFEKLCDEVANNDANDVVHVVYEGWLTFGGAGVPHRSVRGSVRRMGDVLLVLAEHDVVQLERTNREITQLNSEITNLQRELALRKLELQRALDDLRETQTMLIHAEKMNALGQLVAGVAHEINNPISFVNSNLHSLRQTLGDITGAYRQLEELVLADAVPEHVHAVHAIRQKADLDFVLADLDDLFHGSLTGLHRVKKIVEDLRTYSRLDEAEFKSADLQEGITSTLAIVQPALHNRISVTVDLDDLPPIHCYPAELNQVFMNLIVNAAQAIEGQGTITIRGRDAGGEIVLAFEDSGAGIPAGHIDRIFEPFFTTKPVGQGTGLGLALAYRIVTEHHQGAMRVQSTPGQGTTFTISLPKDLRHER